MEVFLFPLVNVTLFPGTTKPLNVFEPRYLAMIQDAIKTQTPIAIGFIDDVSKVATVQPGDRVPFVREVAGYGYAQIVEQRLNGSFLVFLRGQGKVKLGKVLDRGTPYLVCEAEILTENNELATTESADLGALFKGLARWIHTYIPDQDQREVFMRNLNSPEEIVGSFSTYLVRDYDMQQVVLELNDINEKIRFLHRLMESSELTT